MSKSIMYQEDAYVVLETDQPEQIVTSEELFHKLQELIASHQHDLPRELAKLETLEAKTKHLMENYYEFDLGADQYLQWYVIRLSP